MAQTIKLKRSSVASAVPSLSSLELGEVAINTNDGAIYIKRDDGSSPLDILAVHHEPTMHIDYTNNRIGIGTSSPSAIIDARDTTGSLTATQDKTAEFGRYDGTSNPRLEIRHSTAGTDLNHSYSTGANSLTFSIVGSEKMRLDSSGNLLVGKNSNSFNTDGIQANSDGQLWATSTTTPAAFNRRSTHGSIATFYKDSGVVGKIGSNSGSLYIADDDTGLFFNRASDNILPYRNDSGNEGPYDAALDLGRATARFKDFYLSGSIQGPSTFYIDPSPDDTGSPGGSVTDTGTVVILGDLQVNGTTKAPTFINETSVIGTAAASYNLDATDFSSIYVTADATANVTVNVRGDASTTLDSTLAVGDTISVEVLLTNGATAYYNSALQIDGVAQTVDWVDGIEATTGTANEIDAYQYQILKTATNTYTVIGSFYIVGGTAPKTFIVSSGTSGDATLIIEADTDNNDDNDNPRLWFKQDGGIIESAVQMSNNTLDIINNTATGGGIRFLTGTTNNTGTTDPATGATEAMRVTSAGNVGMGDTTPDEKLSVYGAVTSSYQAANFAAGPYRANMDIIDSSKKVRFGSIQGSNTPTGNEGEVGIYVNSNEQVTINTSGNVGIGESNPQRKLVVRGDYTGGQTNTALYNADTTDGNRTVLSFRGDTTGVGATSFYEFGGISMRMTSHDHPTRAGVMQFATGDSSGVADRMVIDEAGNVGIGTASPNYKLEVAGSIGNSQFSIPNTAGTSGQVLAWPSSGTELEWAAAGATPGGSDTHVQYNSSGSLAGSASFTFNSGTGQVTAVDFNSTSDERKKDNIQNLTSENILENLRPVSFTWKENGKDAYGLIAQEVEKVLPEIVSENNEGTKSIAYAQIIPFLIDEILKLKKEVEDLKNGL